MRTAFDPEFAIEAPRLYLSHFDASNEAHCDFLVKLYASDEAIAGFGNSGINTRQAARAFIDGFMRSMLERNGYGPWLVSLKPADGAEGDRETMSAKLAQATPIGTVTMMRGAEPDCYTVPDIGFVTHPNYMRRGYTKEACLAAMEYTTRAYGVQSFLGMTDPHNEPALAVFRSLGFQDHGVHPIKVFSGKPGAVWTSDDVSDLSSIGF